MENIRERKLTRCARYVQKQVRSERVLLVSSRDLFSPSSRGKDDREREWKDLKRNVA